MSPTELVGSTNLATVIAVDVTQYLSGHGVQVYRANGSEITFHCLWCPDGDGRGKGKCYINTETWLYDCKRCGERGNRRTLLKHFGDEEEVTYLPGADPGKRRRVLEESAAVAHQMLLNNDEMLAYLIGERGLSAATITEYKLGFVPDAWPLSRNLPTEHSNVDKMAAGILTESGYEFHANKITIPYLSHGSCVSIRGKDPKGKYFTATGDAVRLFNADRLRGAEEVIITEGEFDCLVLQQKLELSSDPRVRATAVVGIPGAEALPVGFEGYFTEAKRVYVALDPDETGKRAALRIKEILGSKARVVSLPEELPKCDWTDYIVGRKASLDDVLGLLSTSSGRRLWQVRDANVRWRRREIDAPGIKTGFGDLDAWFRPGMQAGDLIIPIAKTGVGKTNFLCNVAYNTRAYPTIFITLEMMAVQVYERLRMVHHFWNPMATDEQINEAFSLLRIVDEARLREGDLEALCDEFADEVGMRPQLGLLDYLGYYAKGCKGVGQYEKTTNACISLKEGIKTAEIALVAPHQVNRQAEDGRPLEASDARDSGAVEEIADLMISLYRPVDAIKAEQQGDLNGIVRMGCLKNRKGGKGMHTNLRWSSASLVLTDDGTEAARMAEEENRLIWRGEDYQGVRAMRKGLAEKQAQLPLQLVSS